MTVLTNALIANMRTLLARAPLHGHEVPAYVEIMSALDAIEQLNNTPPPPPTSDS